MTYELQQYQRACKILDYLIIKHMGFCWTEQGEFITRESCEKIINEFNTLK